MTNVTRTLSLEINVEDLDGELIRFPSDLYEAGEQAVQAVSVRDNAKTTLDWTSADVEANIREQLKLTGEKSTEAAIKNQIERNTVYRTDTMTYLAAKTTAANAEAFLAAMTAKGKMLQKLADLAISRGTTSDRAYGSIRRDMADQRVQR